MYDELEEDIEKIIRKNWSYETQALAVIAKILLVANKSKLKKIKVK
jgi:hypothetical protein